MKLPEKLKEGFLCYTSLTLSAMNIRNGIPTIQECEIFSFQQVLENSVISGYDPQEQLDKSVERINAKLKRYTYENE